MHGQRSFGYRCGATKQFRINTQINTEACMSGNLYPRVRHYYYNILVRTFNSTESISIHKFL